MPTFDIHFFHKYMMWSVFLVPIPIIMLITSYPGQTNHNIKMGRDPSFNRPTTAVAGGSSAQPTPANNVGGGEGWGDRLWLGGKEEGLGHAVVCGSVPTGQLHNHTLTSSNSHIAGYQSQINNGRLPFFARAKDERAK